MDVKEAILALVVCAGKAREYRQAKEHAVRLLLKETPDGSELATLVADEAAKVAKSSFGACVALEGFFEALEDRELIFAVGTLDPAAGSCTFGDGRVKDVDPIDILDYSAEILEALLGRL